MFALFMAAGVDVVQLGTGGLVAYVAIQGFNAIKARRSNGNGNGNGHRPTLDVRDDVRAVLAELLLPELRKQTDELKTMNKGISELLMWERDRRAEDKVKAVAAAAGAHARAHGPTEKY